MTLPKDEFLKNGAALLKRETITIPDLGEVQVFELSAAEAEKLDAANYPAGSDGKRKLKWAGYRTRTIIAGVRDADGRPLFTDADHADIEALPSRIVTLLSEACERVNGFSSTSSTEADVKNSPASPSA
jgi:hypothetical protein